MTSSTLHTTVFLVVYIITLLIGFPANVVAFYTFSKKVRQKAMPIDILLLNLSISDLILLLILPIKIKELMDEMIWKMPHFLCSMTIFIFFTTIYNSTFLLTAISVERYLGVAFPIKYKLKRRPLHAMVATFFFWVISMLHVSVIFIIEHIQINNTQRDPKGPSCYRNFNVQQMKVLMPFRLEVFLVLFCIPFVICCFCYVNLLRILSKLPNISKRKRLRAIGLSVGTLLVFIVCFAPYNLSHLVGFASWANLPWREDALLTSIVNASLDPIIFYFSSSALRVTFHQLLKRGMCYQGKTLSCPMTFCSKTQVDIAESSNESSL